MRKAKAGASQISEHLADPRGVRDSVRRHSRSAAILSSSRHHLIARYRRRWIAVHDGKVRAVSKTLDGLFEEMARKKLPSEDAIIRFIDQNQLTLIL